MKSFLELLLKTILGDGEEFVVEEVKSDDVSIFTIKVNPDLIGKIIGKEGKTIKAIKNLAAIKAKGQNHFFIKIEEAKF